LTASVARTARSVQQDAARAGQALTTALRSGSTRGC